MKKLVVLFVMLCFTEAGIAETRGTHYTPQQIHKKSTLVFRGVVTKIETVEKHKKTFPTDAEVSEILKGELNKRELTFAYKHPGRCVIFREEFNVPKVGEEGVFYLQDQGETLVLIGYIKTEQDGADQPATAPESNPEDDENPKPESKVRSQ